MPARPPAAARGIAPLALLLAAACVTAPGGPRAPLVTDRPDFTESALTVPVGSMQVEAGATYTDEAGVDGVTVGEVLVRASLGSGRELRIGLPSHMTESGPVPPAGSFENKGFSDVSLGAKLALFAPGGGASRFVPTVAAIVGTTLPTGAGGFDAEDPEPEAKLLLAWTVSDRVALSSNVNWSRVSGADAYDELAASLSLGLGLADVVGSYVEVFGFAPDHDAAPRPTYLNGGLTWLLSPDVQLDARVGVGVADAPDSRFVGIGLSRRW